MSCCGFHRRNEPKHSALVEALIAALPDLGDALAAQAVSLFDDPTSERAEIFAASLDCARRAVVTLGERLWSEGGGHG